jgi:hypothetical protein
MMATNGGSQTTVKDGKQHGSGNESEVNVRESENDNPDAEVEPGRTPGKAEGVEDPELAGNE